MTPRAKARAAGVAIILTGLTLAAALVLFGLSGSISFFMTPAQIIASPVTDREIRLGGMVQENSIERTGENVRFIVHDTTASLPVIYKGVLPDLFREGQGIVVYGRYDAATQSFIAAQVLAKHDENYMPPELKKAMQKQEPRP